MIVCIVVESVIFLLFNIPILVSLIQIKINNKRVSRCIGDVSSLGQSISIIAPIRKGKTRFLNGLTNLYENNFLYRIIKEMEDCKRVFHFLDFNIIDNYLLSAYNQSDDLSFWYRKAVFENLISILKLNDGIYNDFINNKSIYQLFYRYCDDFYILYFRKCFVVSKNSMYSFVTKTFSKYLYDETLNINEVIENKCFYLERYLVVCYDEKSLDRGNILSNSKVEKMRGRKELTALCGQIFEETTYFISVKQAADDEEISERRLIVSNLWLKDSVITNDLYFCVAPFMLLRRMLYLRYLIFYKLNIHYRIKYKGFDHYIASNRCKFRFKDLRLKHYIDYIRSQAVCNNLIYNYAFSADVGKKNEELYEEKVFAFPLKFCIGCYDTHEYRFLLDMLSKMSEVSFASVPRLGFFKTSQIKTTMSEFLRRKKV